MTTSAAFLLGAFDEARMLLVIDRTLVVIQAVAFARRNPELGT